MGAHSTLCISRRVALEAWHRLNSVEPTDDQLEAFFDAAFDPFLYNVSVNRYTEEGRDDTTALDLAERIVDDLRND